MAKLTLEELTKMALAQDADTITLVEDFPVRTALEIPMNPEVEGDTSTFTVAELSVEDSRYGPILWAIALEYLKEAREAQSI